MKRVILVVAALVAIAAVTVVVRVSWDAGAEAPEAVVDAAASAVSGAADAATHLPAFDETQDLAQAINAGDSKAAGVNIIKILLIGVAMAVGWGLGSLLAWGLDSLFGRGRGY